MFLRENTFRPGPQGILVQMEKLSPWITIVLCKVPLQIIPLCSGKLTLNLDFKKNKQTLPAYEN